MRIKDYFRITTMSTMEQIKQLSKNGNRPLSSDEINEIKRLDLHYAYILHSRINFIIKREISLLMMIEIPLFMMIMVFRLPDLIFYLCLPIVIILAISTYTTSRITINNLNNNFGLELVKIFDNIEEHD